MNNCTMCGSESKTAICRTCRERIAEDNRRHEAQKIEYDDYDAYDIEMPDHWARWLWIATFAGIAVVAVLFGVMMYINPG